MVSRDAGDASVDLARETFGALEPRFTPWEVSTAPCSDDGWCWENPWPAGGSIATVGARGSDAWLVTREGIALVASAGGLRALRIHPYDPSQTMATVALLGPNDVWVASPGLVLHWNGARFERVTFFDGVSEPTLVWARSPDDLWLAGPVGTVIHFDGTTWSSQPLPTGADVRTLSGGGVAELWAQDADGTVWRRRRGTWVGGETRAPEHHRSVWILAADDAWSCGDGVAFHWDGTRWHRETIAPAPASHACTVWSDGHDVWFSDGTFVRRRDAEGQWSIESETVQVTAVGGSPDDLWLGRRDGVVQRLVKGRFVGVTRTRPRFDVIRLVGDDETTLRALTPATLMGFDGRAWFEANIPTRFYELHGAWPVDAHETWLAGLTRITPRDGGRISRWSREMGERDVLETDAPLRAVGGSSPDDLWAVGDAGAAWHWNGAHWTRAETPAATTLRDVWVHGRNDAWAVGDGATALHWNGTRWRATSLPMTVDLSRVHGRASDDVWSIGRDARGSWVFRWDGAQWQRDTAGLPAGYVARDVWSAPDGRVWLAGSSLLRREGGVWRREDTGVEGSLHAVRGVHDGTVRAAGSDAMVLSRRP